jgi:mono/diheme cytochrome c family protein
MVASAALIASMTAGAQELHAVTQKYCVSCHNPEDWAGGLDLDSIDHGHVAAEAETWEKVVLKLRAGMMPPPGKARPSRQQVESIAAMLEGSLDAAPRQAVPAPAMHRLNRSEYANAIRDLFGMQVDVSSMLPPDDASNGFDNMAAGLSISPALIQGYTTAAMKLSRAAVGDMSATETTVMYQAPANLAQDQHLEGLPLGSRGGMRVAHNFPLDAEYHFSIRGGFSLDRNPSVRVDVAIDGVRVEPRSLRDFRLPMKAGPHVITAALFDQRRPAGVNDIYSVYKVQGLVDTIEITGPFNATGPGDTESRRRIFSCRPAAESQSRACAQKILLDMASRAFRGPQRPADLAVIMPFYERGLAAGGFERGIEQALSRVLVDPRFLFRMEGDAADLDLASRLSFFLWSSIPDKELLDRAVAGTLHRPGVLAAQVKRMLADERASALVENFAGQWLFLRQLATVTPEVDGFDENLREAFITETRSLVEYVLRQDRPVTELLTADYSFLNERLARHYGIAGVRGSHLRKVTLPPESHRRGLLGHGSILTITSTASRTSPVIRGSWILENLLGSPPPAPPPGVETNIDGDGTKVLTTSVRQRLEAHRANPSCAACHGVIDPVGFALENFNPIGAWRERDGDSAVDARGTLVDGTSIAGPEDLTAALTSRSQLFITHVAEKLLAYSLGRTLDYRDMPAVRHIVRQAQGRSYSLVALIDAVVQSEPFLQRAGAAPAVRLAARE